MNNMANVAQTPFINNMYFVKTRGKRKIKARVRKFTIICILAFMVLIGLKIYIAIDDKKDYHNNYYLITSFSTIPVYICEIFFSLLATLKRFIKTNYLFF